MKYRTERIFYCHPDGRVIVKERMVAMAAPWVELDENNLRNLIGRLRQHDPRRFVQLMCDAAGRYVPQDGFAVVDPDSAIARTKSGPATDPENLVYLIFRGKELCDRARDFAAMLNSETGE